MTDVTNPSEKLLLALRNARDSSQTVTADRLNALDVCQTVCRWPNQGGQIHHDALSLVKIRLSYGVEKQLKSKFT